MQDNSFVLYFLSRNISKTFRLNQRVHGYAGYSMIRLFDYGSLPIYGPMDANLDLGTITVLFIDMTMET